MDNGSTAQYKYDHQNRRVSKIIGSSWTHYVWQGGQVIGEHDATTAYTTNPSYQVNSARLDYVYSGNQRIYSRERASSGGSWTTRYYLSDRLSTRLVLDASGNVLGRQAHLPFGEGFGESGTQEKHHFTGYERDSESGTDYGVNRQHVGSLGRFMSADAYTASGSVGDPQSWNRYSFAASDPVNRIDPLGLFWIPAAVLDAIAAWYYMQGPVDAHLIGYASSGGSSGGAPGSLDDIAIDLGSPFEWYPDFGSGGAEMGALLDLITLVEAYTVALINLGGA